MLKLSFWTGVSLGEPSSGVSPAHGADKAEQAVLWSLLALSPCQHLCSLLRDHSGGLSSSQLLS